jgi:hypothetical protein
MLEVLNLKPQMGLERVKPESAIFVAGAAQWLPDGRR